MRLGRGFCYGKKKDLPESEYDWGGGDLSEKVWVSTEEPFRESFFESTFFKNVGGVRVLARGKRSFRGLRVFGMYVFIVQR